MCAPGGLSGRDDARQVSAAEEFVAAGAWVPHLALAEASWVLGGVYELRPRDIATAIGMLLNHRDLSLQEPEVVAAALEMFRRRPSLGFSDCLLVAVAKKAGLECPARSGDLWKRRIRAC